MLNEKDFENMEKNLEEQLGNNVQEAEEEIRNAESTEVINEEITQESAADYSNNSVSEIVNDKVDEAVDNAVESVSTSNQETASDVINPVYKQNEYSGAYSYSRDNFDFNTGFENQGKPKKKKSVFKKVVFTAACIAAIGGCGFAINKGYSYFADRDNTKKTESSSRKIATTGEVETKVQISTASGTGTASTSGGGVVITDVSDVVEDVMPSIVAITSTIKVSDYDYFDWFGEGGSYEQEGAGSGIIVGETDDELLIVTNNHVVADSTSLSVQFINDDSVEADIKGTDPDADLAIVSIPLDTISDDTLSAIKIATLGDSDKLSVGDGVIAIGNALGYGQSVTTGVVSALNREVQVDDNTLNLIQTDAAINGGNSGGALINANGEVIGINVAKYSQSSYSSSASIEGMGFAIPVSQALNKINELMNRETRKKVDEDKRGYLGISGYTVSESESETYGVPVGVLVTEVADGSAADKAGIQNRDVITAIEGITVSTMDELKEQLEYYAVGDEVEITISYQSNRDYEEKTVSVTLGSSETLPTEKSDIIGR